MSGPWEQYAAPAAPAAEPKPWEQYAAPVTTGVPTRAAAPAAPPPSVTDKIRSGIGAGLNLAADTVDSITGMAGHGMGLLGGLAGALGVSLRGGVQPDDPRVVAAGSGPVQGADARALASGGRGTGEVAVPQTAIDEAGQQGAQQVTGAVHQAAGLLTQTGPARAGRAAMQSFQTPEARDIANDVEAPGGLMAHIDPQIAMTMHAPVGAMAEGAGAVGSAARAVAAPVARAAGEAGAAAKDAVAKGAAKTITKVLPSPDPELVKVAQLADQFPHPMQIMPDRLLPEGAAKMIAEDVSGAPLTGGSQIEHANKEAFTKNLISLINPDETTGRLTPKTLDAALDSSGKAIGEGYDQAGAIPVAELQTAMERQLAESTNNGAGDVPRLVQNRFTEILKKADADGNVPADALRQWDSDLGRQARSLTDDEAAGHISDLQSDVRDLVESKLTPEQAQAVKDARRRYAYGMIVAPEVAKSIDGLVQPGSLMQRVTSSRGGKAYMARDNGGQIGDLAKVGKLMDNTAKPDVGAAAVAHAAGKALGSATGLSTVAGKVYNKAAPGVTRMLAPKVKKPPVAAPPELELAPPGALPSQAAPPAPAGPLGDLTPDWETAPGAAGADTRGAPVDATDLHPALGDDVVTTGNPAPPSAGAPGSQVPAVPGRPDLPDAMVSGPPGETASTDAANAAMHEPGAIAARAAQETAAKGAADAETSAAAAKKAAEPKPDAAEQSRLDEIDKTLAGTQSAIVRETLEKERARVMKDVGARDTLEKTKAAAGELRTSAEAITDPATKKALLAKADKLDPPELEPKAKPAEEPLPSIEYADTPEWRKAHGLGPEDAQRAILTRQAFDLDADAVDAAAVQHASSPRAFDRAVDKILEKHRANETPSAAQGGQEPAPGKASGNVGAKSAAPDERGAGAEPPAGGRAAGQPELEDPHAEAARLAKFHLDHPRASDGTFTEKE